MRRKNFQENSKTTYTKQDSNINNEENDEDKKVVLYSKFAEEVFAEINLALTKPSEYAAKLERIYTTLKGRKAKVGEHTIKLKEGAAIFDEAIHYLLNIGPMDPLELCEGLSESANELLYLLIIQEGVDMSDFNLDIYDLEHRLDHFGHISGSLMN